MHNFDIKTKEIEINGRPLKVETGRMAKQANGAVYIQYGKTSMLVTATADNEPREGTDFFPLTVDFVEKMYASGKIPGGFFKREARPSTTATLNARLIDRAIRPMFPDGFRNAVHVVITVLSYDGVNSPAQLGITGASLALGISDIPFHGPVAGVCVAMKDSEYIVNPTEEVIAESKLELDVAGTETSIVMIEAGAEEVTEAEMKEAIYKGHDVIKELVGMQKEFIADAGKEKMEVVLDLVPEEIVERLAKDFGEAINSDAKLLGKLERYEAFNSRKDEMLAKYQEEDSEEIFAENVRYYKNGFEDLIKKSVREAILKDNHRVDGRGMDDIRPITCEVDILPIVHGSALFTRGETQSLGTVTLGTGRDQQIIDGLADEYKKNYYLHYNFPPFSVGEAGFMRGPGRRELGHGALAERALKPLLPKPEDFPYTIRIVSEILESNGSSSMATVCSGTLALMAAGVPLKKPVAGIANGLIMDDGEYVVLTDIMGLEDHLGDMDFKVTGTRDGITAMQMDIKIEGITNEIMGIALEKALVARHYILDKIEAVMAEPRSDLSESAPRIEQFIIPTDKIGEVIGPSGKNIKAVIEDTGVDVNIEDDGTISIASNDAEGLRAAKERILSVVMEPEMNEVYDGVVTRIEPYGCFVKFMNRAKEGLVHISQMHTARIDKVEDMVALGDEVKVKFIGTDKGKYKISMKGVEGNKEPKISASSGDNNRRSYDRNNRNDRNDRNDRNRRNDRNDRNRNSRYNKRDS